MDKSLKYICNVNENETINTAVEDLKQFFNRADQEQAFLRARLSQLELKGAIKNLMLVHGIGTSNFPGQEGKKIAHAWLTFGKDDEFLAFEPTWGLITEAAKVIKDLQVEHVSTYRHSHLVKEITKNNNIDIGPWDKKILEVLGVREEI